MHLFAIMDQNIKSKGGFYMDSEVLNLEQAMELFGVSERTMIKLLREERIPARKIGREWRFNRSALLDRLGKGDSINYLNQTEQYRVAIDTKASIPQVLEQIEASVTRLKSGDSNIRQLLPELDGNIPLPDEATLRVSYKRQREIEKLTFKIFWPIRGIDGGS